MSMDFGYFVKVILLGFVDRVVESRGLGGF